MLRETVFNRCSAAIGEGVSFWKSDLSYAAVGKRATDVAIALVLCIALAPFVAMICLALWISDGLPIFFRHTRVGQNGMRFECLKFRTMVRDSDQVLARLLAYCPDARREWELSRKLRRDPRINGRIGAFLRRTSLDEVPQLINVLRGEMSLVGPRPVMDNELPLYGHHRSDYLGARPGITGLWQVSGRSDITFDERVALDVKYLDDQSLIIDIWILLRTLLVPFRRNGAY